MMVGKCDFNGIFVQSLFCKQLIERLHEEIKSSQEGSWSGMKNHIRKQEDIKRIRRELMTLSKMLNPWGSE